MKIYRIVAGSTGVSIYEIKIIKQTEKTIILDRLIMPLFKKNKLDSIEEGLVFNTFQMHTLEIDKEKIENVRHAAKTRWIQKKIIAAESLENLEKDPKYRRLRDAE